MTVIALIHCRYTLESAPVAPPETGEHVRPVLPCLPGTLQVTRVAISRSKCKVCSPATLIKENLVIVNGERGKEGTCLNLISGNQIAGKHMKLLHMPAHGFQSKFILWKASFSLCFESNNFVAQSLQIIVAIFTFWSFAGTKSTRVA